MTTVINGTTGTSIAGNSATIGNFAVGGALAVTGNQTVGGNLTVTGSLSTSGGAVTFPTIKSTTANTPTEFQDSTGAQIGTLCRAWVNFNGTGAVAIRRSFNVTTIGDNGLGDYTMNFAIAMPDADYCVVTANGQDTPGSAALRTAGPAQTTSVTTTSVRLISGYMGAGAPNRQAEDCAVYNAAVFR